MTAQRPFQPPAPGSGAAAFRPATIGHEGLDAFRPATAWGRCLIPFLAALGWTGDARQLAEALPHGADALDAHDLRAVLAELGWKTHCTPGRIATLDPRTLPALFVAPSGEPFVICDSAPAGDDFRPGWRVLSGDDGVIETLADDDPRLRGRGEIWTVEPLAEDVRLAERDLGWHLVQRFRRLLVGLGLLTLTSNILALALPLFIMAAYAFVVPAGTAESAAATLGWLGIGLGIALAGDGALRMLRSRAVAHVGARVEWVVGVAVFRKLMSMPARMVEGAPINRQMMRLRQYESLRDFFSGPLVGVVLDLPFVTVFLLAIAILSPPLALVVAALALVLSLAAVITLPTARRSQARLAAAREARQSMTMELLGGVEALQAAGLERPFLERYRLVAAEAAEASRRQAAMTAGLQAFAQVAMLGTGALVLFVGAAQVLAGALSPGALVAIMAISWRTVSPIQTAFLSLPRLQQTAEAFNQLRRLLEVPEERDLSAVPRLRRRFRGQIVARALGFRWEQGAEPAVAGASLEIRPGEIVAITGPSGSGKSTLLRLIGGLAKPQAGAVAIDGIDLRQIDPVTLRRQIVWLPQHDRLIHGTVAQNLRLAEPTAPDEALIEACHAAGVLEEIEDLPEGFNTRLTDRVRADLPASFVQGLLLARVWLRDASVVLLDDPAQTLAGPTERAFMDRLEACRGRQTVVMVTARPSHMRLADRVVVLRDGRIAADGPPEEILTGRSAA